MEDGEIERLEKEMTPELACDIISKILEELKKGNRIQIIKRVYKAEKPLTIHEILQEDRSDVISLYGLGILGRKEINSLTKHEVVYFLTEFTKELLGIKEVEE